MWAAILGALQAVPVLVDVIKEAVKLIGSLVDEITKLRRIAAFREAAEHSKKTGDTSKFEELLRNPPF